MERLLTFSNQQLLFITVIKTLGIHKAESLCCTLETVTDYVNQLDSNIKQKVYKMKEKLVKEENLRDKQHFTWQVRKLRLKEGQDSTPGFASSPCQGSACSEVLPTLVQRAPGWKPHLASCEVRATSIPEKMIAHTPSLR